MAQSDDPLPVAVPAETVSESARVRHFDELDETAQESLAGAVDGPSSPRTTSLPGLSSGDVVVFTDYYRIR
jgi:hypothetical protein